MTCVKCGPIFERITTVEELKRYVKGESLSIEGGECLHVDYHPPRTESTPKIPERYVVSCTDCGATQKYVGLLIP